MGEVPGGTGRSAGAVRTSAEWAAAACVLAAVVLVPLVISGETPYALDLRRPVSETLALLAGLALAVRWAAGGRLTRSTRTLLTPLVLFLAAAALSAGLSQHRTVAIRELWAHLAHVLLFLAVAVAFRRIGRAWALIAAMLAAGTVVALSGCDQAAGSDLFGYEWYKRGVPVPLGRGARVLGTIGLETALGGYTAACAVLAAGVALATRRRAVRFAAAGAALLSAACMVLSGTRTAWAGFAVGLVLLGVALRRTADRRARRVFVALLVVAVLVAAALFGPFVVRRVAELPGHVGVRATIWRAAWGMFLDSPVTGKGPGTFSAHFPAFRPADYAQHGVSALTLRAHSEYLEVLAEAGLLAAVPLAIFLGLFILGSVRAARLRGGPRGALLWSAFAAVATMLVHAAASVDTRYPTCRMTLWVLGGLAVALWEEEPRGDASGARVSWRVAAVAVAAVCAVPVWSGAIRRPYLARVHLGRAERAARQGRHAESNSDARRAVELDPASAPARYALADALAQTGSHPEALAEFGELNRVSPHYTDVDLRIGELRAQLGNVDGARAAFRTARRYGVLPGTFSRFESLDDDALRALAAGDAAP